MKRSLAALSIGLVWVVSGLTGQAQDRPNFLNLVTVGDSLSAGFISGVLREEAQINAWPALISRQVGTFHFLPLMPAPGVGQEITLVDGNLVIGPLTGGTTSRGFPLIVPQNLAIPGQDVAEALTSRPDFTDAGKPFENLILGVPVTAIFGQAPVSQIELAVGLQPSFTLLWLGSNDVLGVATSGATPTPFPVFQVAYQTAVGALLTLTNTKLIVATVPDVTVIPFITSAEEVAAAVGAPLGLIGPALGIGAGDFVRPGGAGLVQPILTGQVAGPIPESQILRAATVAETRVLIATMNGFIMAFAAQAGFPVVDTNAVLSDIDANGLPLSNGQVLTTDLLGGIFSLDGVHPTATGQGVIANSFIQRINQFWGLQIPEVDLNAIAATDPLVFPAMAPETRFRYLRKAAPILTNVAQSIFGTADELPDTRFFDPGQDPGLEEEISSQSVEEYLLNSLRRIQVEPGPMQVGVERRRVPSDRGEVSPRLRRP